MSSSSENVNIEYELLTKEIYETLLTSEGITVDVKHNVVIQGKALKHQIDVYWEYKIADIIHRVAIECKNYNSKVSIAKVRDFYGALDDIGNINGIMVSKKGFQKGAIEFSQFYGINLRELRNPSEEDWKNRIKKIQIDINLITKSIKERKFNLDFDWIKENLAIDDNNPIPLRMQGMANEIWIFDENGGKITNLYEIENNLPQNWKTEESLIHKEEFANGYLKIGDKSIKINNIEFIYDVRSGDPVPMIIDGEEMTKAILKDAVSGEIKFFNKDGSYK